MKTILVFCGSAHGKSDKFSTVARSLGKFLAQQNFHLLTGGGSVGLMGEVANAALEHNGKVTGIIPEFLENREVGHQQLTELIVVDNMHTRKRKMYEMADAAIVLPGGVGTMDECFEYLCWNGLGLLQGPLGILNVDIFYTPLIQQIDLMIEEGFIRSSAKDLYFSSDEVSDLMSILLKKISL